MTASLSAILEGTVEAKKFGSGVAGAAVRKIRYSHDAMIDEIIGNPAVSQGTLASMFGYTPGWVSQVMASDVFQARLAARKDEIVDPVLRMTVEEKIKGLVNRSLEILMEKMEGPANTVPNALVLKALELGAKGLGLGGNAPPPAPKSPDLDILADRLIALRGDVYRRVPDEKVVESVVLPSPG